MVRMDFPLILVIVCVKLCEYQLLEFGIKMASVLYLALCWTHGFINS